MPVECNPADSAEQRDQIGSWPRDDARTGSNATAIEVARLLAEGRIQPDLCGGRLIPAVPPAVPSGPSPDGINGLDRSKAAVLYRW